MRSRCSSWSVCTTVFGNGFKKVFGAFLLHTPKTSSQFVVTSVRLQRTASYRSVVKKNQFFVLKRHFVWCAARQHIVGCIVSTYSICHVIDCVFISSVAVCLYVLCCMQGTPTVLSSSMCMCSVFCSRLTPTVEPMRAGPHLCYYHEQDATEICWEHDSRNDSSFIGTE